MSVGRDIALSPYNAIRISVTINREKLANKLQNEPDGPVLMMLIHHALGDIEKCRLDLLAEENYNDSRWISLLDRPNDGEDLCIVVTRKDYDKFHSEHIVGGIINTVSTAISSACSSMYPSHI